MKKSLICLMSLLFVLCVVGCSGGVKASHQITKVSVNEITKSIKDYPKSYVNITGESGKEHFEVKIVFEDGKELSLNLSANDLVETDTIKFWTCSLIEGELNSKPVTSGIIPPMVISNEKNGISSIGFDTAKDSYLITFIAKE